ncbi:hypothetical protein D3C85_486660 [compost metagenome]
MLEGGDEDDLGARPRLEIGRHGHAALARHLNVQKHDVGLKPLDGLSRQQAVGGRTDDRDLRQRLQQHLQTFDRRRLVVSDEQAHHWTSMGIQMLAR